MGTNETTKEGFYRDLLTPLSIIAGIQVALMIAQIESEYGGIAESYLASYTLGLFFYAFVAHMMVKEGGKLGEFLATQGKWIFLVLTGLMVVATVIAVIYYAEGTFPPEIFAVW